MSRRVIMNHELEGLLMQELLKRGGVKRELAETGLMYFAVTVVVILSFPIVTYLA